MLCALLASLMSSTMPLSARSNYSANAAAVHVMPGGAPLTSRPKNPLLVRDGVGRAKPSCYDLPYDGFSYGRPGNHDAEGAREVSMHWVSHKPSAMPEASAPDFVWFNKRATSAKVSNAKDLSLFRKEMESITPRSFGQRSPRSSTAPARSKAVVPSDIVSGFTYGKKIRPSTPIDEVISYRFQAKSEDELMKFYTEYRQNHEQAMTQVRKIPVTTASRGHGSKSKQANQHVGEHKDLFKITKFKNVGCKINNGRYKPAHEQLFERMAAQQLAADMENARAAASDVPSEMSMSARDDPVPSDLGLIENL